MNAMRIKLGRMRMPSLRTFGEKALNGSSDKGNVLASLTELAEHEWNIRCFTASP